MKPVATTKANLAHTGRFVMFIHHIDTAKAVFVFSYVPDHFKTDRRRPLKARAEVEV